MVIRKLFKVESAHIVRNCSSERCKKSIHGHSAVVEVFFETSDKLDNGQMIYDFGLMKGTIKDFVDAMDHCYLLWNKEKDDFKDFIYENSSRVITLPFSPSAESLSLFLFKGVKAIINATQFNNGEGDIKVKAVRYHETVTGYAESTEEDLHMLDFNLDDIIFSEGVKAEWNDPKMWDKTTQFNNNILVVKPFNNPVVEQQV